jgi:DNA-binding SARP family transcriptional activator
MDFRVLGPLEVRDDDRPVELGTGRQRKLLAILLLRANEVVSTDRLIDEVWDGRPPPTAAKALQGHVSQLRKLLGQQTLVTQPPGYLLRVAPEQVDVLRAERLIRAAEDAQPAEATTLLRDALQLWRGPPMADFASDDFARNEAARLEELQLTALEKRIEADLALGRHVEVVGELEALVRAHPLRERLRGQLILALYRSGRQAEALDAYQAARKTLVEELGLEPSEELQQLQRAILAHDPSLGPTAKVPSVEAAPGPSRPARRPAPAEPSVPTGTVTFLFTDIEGSTTLVRQLGGGYSDVLAEHQRILRQAFAAHGGHEVDAQGDSFFVAFRRAKDAVAAAVDAQRDLAAHHWPEEAEVRVRMGLHTGEPKVGEERYAGIGVYKAARIGAAGHGGQVVLSSTTRELVEDELPPGVTIRDLGERRLRTSSVPSVSTSS